VLAVRLSAIVNISSGAKTTSERRNMKSTATFLSLFLLAATGTFANQPQVSVPNSGMQTISRSGSQSPQKGSAEFFTGDVQIVPLFSPNDSAQFSGGSVTFAPGARSVWHTHPLGQRLIVTDGVGRTQQWGGSVEEIRAGDVVWCPPGVKHWHGASPNTAMTHITIAGDLNGENVKWLERVSDEQYNGR
jgi:quercetin dioxygenase-like cupin family protein